MENLRLSGEPVVLYYTAGVQGEAWAIGAGIPRGTRVVQVFEAGKAGEDAAAALRAVRPEGVTDLVTTGAWREALEARRAAGEVAVLWLPPSALGDLTADVMRPVWLSGTLLNGAEVPRPLRRGAYVADPYLAAGEEPARAARFNLWRRGRGLPEAEHRIQAQTWFTCLLLREGLDHLKIYFVREYLLDLLDEATGATHLSPIHPRLVFTPGQRYLQRGVYLRGPDGSVTWTVPDGPSG